MEAYYPKYQNRDSTLTFEKFFAKGQQKNNSEFIDFIKNFFMSEDINIPPELADFLIQTLNQDGTVDRCGKAANAAYMKTGLVPAEPSRKNYIFYNAQNGLLEVIQEYDVTKAQAFNLGANGEMESPSMVSDPNDTQVQKEDKRDINLKTLTHITAKFENGKVDVSAQYFVSAGDAQQAKAIIKEVTPKFGVILKSLFKEVITGIRNFLGIPAPTEKPALSSVSSAPTGMVINAASEATPALSSVNSAPTGVAKKFKQEKNLAMSLNMYAIFSSPDSNTSRKVTQSACNEVESYVLGKI